jgi:hypothetical protein
VTAFPVVRILSDDARAEIAARAEEARERRRPPCWRCGRKVGPDGWLTIAQAEPNARGGLRYPDPDAPVAGFFQCHDCALANDDDDAGYDIALSRIRAADGAGGTDSLYGWLFHLRGKRWWRPELYAALETAHVAAGGGAE